MNHPLLSVGRGTPSQSMSHQTLSVYPSLSVPLQLSNASLTIPHCTATSIPSPSCLLLGQRRRREGEKLGGEIRSCCFWHIPPLPTPKYQRSRTIIWHFLIVVPKARWKQEFLHPPWHATPSRVDRSRCSVVQSSLHTSTGQEGEVGRAGGIEGSRSDHPC